MKKARFISASIISIVMTITMIPMTSFAVEGDGAADPGQTQVVEPIDQGSDNQNGTDEQAGETGGTQNGEQGEGTGSDDPTDPTGDDPIDPTEPEEPVFTDIQPVITAQVSGAGIKIQWDEIEGATKYLVYRTYTKGTDPKTLTNIAKVTTTSYKDTKVKSGKKAYYFVRAYNGSEYTKYAEETPCKIIRVLIETGHGIDSKRRWDPGCCWRGQQEAKLMLPIAKSMVNYLRANGIYVYTDAFNKNNYNLLKAVKLANKTYDVSAAVHIHCDYKKAPRGTMPLYKTAEQKKLAKALNKGVHSEVNIKNRGLKRRPGLYALRKSKKPTVIFETGCISKDNKILKKKYDAYGKGLAKGLCSYLGVEFQ